jgi:hypothetical protein
MASGSSSFFKRCLCSGSTSEMPRRTSPLIILTPNSLRIRNHPKRHEVGFKANQLGVSISATASNKDLIFIAKLNAHSQSGARVWQHRVILSHSVSIASFRFV